VHLGAVKMNEIDYLHIPTLLSNRGLFRSFEVLMKLLPPPKYGNLDATPFISVFFPFFFGIILGDTAYGLLLLASAGIVRWKSSNRHVRDAALVAAVAGIFTIFFGFLYGEFLGDFGEHHFGMHPAAAWLHRTQAIEVILLLAISIGVAHIVLGFALKTYVEFIIGHVRGIIEGVSKIVIILGLVLIFIQLLLGFTVVLRYGGYGMIAAGLVGVLFTEGLFGVMEIFSIFGNILSYSRIMAIGLASVILAIVANRLAGAAPNIAAGIAVALVIHLINFVMGVFSPTIHSLRLHYVEFFTKFFKPEGKSFHPFRRMENTG
ncbi:MAG: V-type ATP synthase subunit I, partial [Candidatus Latescibacteria bacterium]|nr:V-type ATP synthase subunit I [Candidatus Latescibacterota bacterium]